MHASSAPSAPRGEPGPVRTDAGPLLKRFPALGEPISVVWQAGTMGDPRIPGPSTYWIDAVVHLKDAALGGLPVTESLSPSSAPEITPGIRDNLPSGPWFTGAVLDQALIGGGFSVTAHLAPGASTVVLRARGSGGTTP